jgi:CheY-like chemotaxis protein
MIRYFQVADALPSSITASEGPSMNTQNPPNKAKSPTKAIMVVDDDPQVLTRLKQMLAYAGYSNLMLCQSAENALDLINGGTCPAIIFTDCRMPGMDGLTLIREVHKRLPALPCYLITGTPEDAASLIEADYILDKGDTAFMTKFIGLVLRAGV